MMERKTDKKRHPTEPIKPRRPFSVTFILWIFILWVLLGWLRFARAWIDRSLILDLLPVWHFWYFVLAGIFWGLAGLPIFWGILRRAPWTPAAIWIGGLFYPAVYWVERLLLWTPSQSQDNWLFMLLLTVFWFFLIAWANTSKRGKRFFTQLTE